VRECCAKRRRWRRSRSTMCSVSSCSKSAPGVPRGTCSMARSGHPDSADSQFFICFGDASFLNGQYTVWGEVTSGMENVDKIKRGEPVRDPDKIVKASLS